MKLTNIGILVVAILTSAAPLAAEDMKPTPGEYVWASNGNCAKLWVAERLTYIWDKDCNGSADYRGKNVWIRENTLYIDQASFVVSNLTADRIEGTWTLGGDTTTGAFVRK